MPTSANSRVAYLEYGSGGELFRGEQLVVAKHAIKELQSHGKPVVMVAYVHGWNNGSLSADAAKFKEFINHLAKIGRNRNSFEVFGLYCAWPGAYWGPLEIISSPGSTKTKCAWPAAKLQQGPQLFTIWDRYTTALRVASCGEIGRHLGEMTELVHRSNKKPWSFYMGHSMGALILEQAVVKGMPNQERSGLTKSSPDLVFLMNSAAPALLAKRAIDAWKPAYENATQPVPPRVVSITSDADYATNGLAKAGFVVGPTNPLLLRIRNENQPTLSEFPLLFRCPGHVDNLVSWYTNVPEGETSKPDRKACGKPAAVDGQADPWHFGVNLRLNPYNNRKLEPKAFVASDGSGQNQKWIFGWKHEELGNHENNTPYWVVQTGPSLICDHGDIWGTQAVSVMTAAFYEAGLQSR